MYKPIGGGYLGHPATGTCSHTQSARAASQDVAAQHPSQHHPPPIPISCQFPRTAQHRSGGTQTLNRTMRCSTPNRSVVTLDLFQPIFASEIGHTRGGRGGTDAMGRFRAHRFEVGSPYALILPPPRSSTHAGSALTRSCARLNQFVVESGATTSR